MNKAAAVSPELPFFDAEREHKAYSLLWVATGLIFLIGASCLIKHKSLPLHKFYYIPLTAGVVGLLLLAKGGHKWFHPLQDFWEECDVYRERKKQQFLLEMEMVGFNAAYNNLLQVIGEAKTREFLKKSEEDILRKNGGNWARANYERDTLEAWFIKNYDVIAFFDMRFKETFSIPQEWVVELFTQMDFSQAYEKYKGFLFKLPQQLTDLSLTQFRWWIAQGIIAEQQSENFIDVIRKYAPHSPNLEIEGVAPEDESTIREIFQCVQAEPRDQRMHRQIVSTFRNGGFILCKSLYKLLAQKDFIKRYTQNLLEKYDPPSITDQMWEGARVDIE